MVDNILSAIELISAAAGSPESWDLALGGLVNLLNGDHAVMFGTESDMESGAIVARFGIDERDIECWSTPEAAQLAAPFNNNVPIGRAFASSELMPDRDWQRSVYYNELVRPLSGFYSVAVRQARSDCSFLMVVCRERRHGPFAEPEIDTMQRLLPHITTAVELGRRLSAHDHSTARSDCNAFRRCRRQKNGLAYQSALRSAPARAQPAAHLASGLARNTRPRVPCGHIRQGSERDGCRRPACTRRSLQPHATRKRGRNVARERSSAR